MLQGNVQQFLRVANVTAFTKLGVTKDFTGLRCRFRIEKTTESTANTARIEILNLSQESRTFLEGDEMRIQLSAGYPGSVEILALGDIAKAISKHEHPEWITVVESGDGQKALKEKHLDLSWAPGTPFQSIFLQAVEALGVTLGSNIFVITEIATGGYTHSGTVKELMDKLATRFNLEWSIQDGAIQTTSKEAPVPGLAVLVTSENGLLGNVIKTVVKQPDGSDITTLAFKMLINGEIKPGKLVAMDTRDIKGVYKVLKVVFDGDTHDGPWFATVEAISL